MKQANVLPNEIKDLYEETAIEMYKRGDYEFAEELFRAAYDWAQRCPNNEENLAVAMNNLAVVLYARGNYDAAEQMFQYAVEHFEKNLSLNHPDLPVLLYNYAAMLRKQGKVLEAEGLDVCVDVIYKSPNYFAPSNGYQEHEQMIQIEVWMDIEKELTAEVA